MRDNDTRDNIVTVDFCDILQFSQNATFLLLLPSSYSDSMNCTY